MRERLKRILELSDRLGTLRRRVSEGGGSARRKDLIEELRSIAGSVVTIGLPGALGRLATDHKLGPQESMVILLLLHRRLEAGPSGLSGREILSTIFPSAYGVLSGISLLAPESPLRKSGAVAPTGPEAGDCLETSFELTDWLFRAIERDVNPQATSDSERPATPYQNHWEHLADLGGLSGLLLRRANGIFDMDPYGTRVYDDKDPPSLLDRKIEQLERIIERRLAGTPGGERFPLVRLARRLKLGRDEQLILATLLFQECYYGHLGLEAVECLRMVSRSPEELLRKHRLLAPEGRLMREGLVEVESPVEGSELTAELSLPGWMVALLLGEDPTHAPPIGPDVRLEFHEYLQGLGDSEQFYRDLGS